VSGALEVLMTDLEEDDLFELSKYMQKARGRTVDFGGQYLECPRPIDIISSVRAARKVAMRQTADSGCGCDNGWVRLYQYRRVRQWSYGEGKLGASAGVVADDFVAPCRCVGGEFSANAPWWEKFDVAKDARFYREEDKDNEARAKAWRDELFRTMDKWAPHEEWLHQVVLDWPLVKGDFVATMIKRDFWPHGLTFFEGEPKRPEKELTEVQKLARKAQASWKEDIPEYKEEF
jgi:hypothetical protein